MPSGQTETLKNAGGTALSTKTLSYTYDSLGNIETISEGGVQRQKYYYDSLNQLIREDKGKLAHTGIIMMVKVIIGEFFRMGELI